MSESFSHEPAHTAPPILWQFTCDATSNCPPGGLTGEMVLNQLSLMSLSLPVNLLVLFGLMFGYLGLAFIFLNFTVRRLGK